jgi:hypothetical protein
VSQNRESRLPAIRRGADCQLPCPVQKSPSLTVVEDWLSSVVLSVVADRTQNHPYYEHRGRDRADHPDRLVVGVARMVGGSCAGVESLGGISVRIGWRASLSKLTTRTG